MAIEPDIDRRRFLQLGSAAAFAGALPPLAACSPQTARASADHLIRIAPASIELAPRISVTTTTYNGQFPGPLLRFRAGKPVTVDIHNDTAAPEQLHWHGQKLPVAFDGSAEEGTPFIPAKGM